jgi:hypothetical protein
MFTFRGLKGSRLTSAEGDENTRMARDGDRLQIPKAKGYGLRVGPDSDLSFGWHDLIGSLFINDYAAVNAPSFEIYRGGIKQHRFAVNDEAQVSFHMPHDYLPDSDVFIHAHWSHDSDKVIGGSVTWGFELIYAKGHTQASFSQPIIVTELQYTSNEQFMHMICEAPASITGGSANLIDSSILEVDGLIFGRTYLVANDLQTSDSSIVNPFLHTVDIHYQSTGAPTKRKSPNFWI